jgi:hypothetical protein
VQSQQQLEIISDSNWREFVGSTASVLLLTVAECPHCRKWAEELTEFLKEDSDWQHIRFGKIVLDGEDVEDFKRSNEWLDLIDGVPFNVFYQAGEPRNSFHGSGVQRMIRRLERLERERPNRG